MISPDLLLSTASALSINLVIRPQELVVFNHHQCWCKPINLHQLEQVGVGDTAYFKKMNTFFEWIFRILKKWIIFWMNILFFKNSVSKWIILWTNILVLLYLRQYWLLPNVSNSSEISQGSLVGPISVHFRGFITYTGASFRWAPKPYFFLILEFWIIFLIFFLNE